MAQAPLKTLTYGDYSIAIICALEIEVSAVRYMLDEEHANPTASEGDPTGYFFGQISGHNVVVGYLPPSASGGCMAATVATNMKRSFPHITLRILVGIGGGVPSEADDIRLGDVVVSMPQGVHGGVIQYDLGKATLTGFERKGFLESPDLRWQNAVVKLQSDHRTRGTRILAYIDDMIGRYPGLTTYRLPESQDVLFKSTYTHQSNLLTCRNCDYTQLVERPNRVTSSPRIFYGLIASGNLVVKNAGQRDKFAREVGGALCFEMEAAGMMNDLRCLVVRGVSDYADSHKNDAWHAYAAATAAAYTKELLTKVDLPDRRSNLLTSSYGRIDGSGWLSIKSNDTFCPHSGPKTQTRNKHWTIPQQTNPLFTGRTNIIDKIADTVLGALSDNHDPNQCRIVIIGMGGQGKSEICLQVANRLRSFFWGVFWVDVGTWTSAERSFLSISARLSASATDIPGVCQLLANTDNPWLLIIDNADDYGVDYQNYIPSGCGGVILLTSRIRECQQYATHPAIFLEGLASKDAVNLLLKAAHIPQPGDRSALGDAHRFTTELFQGHPLALIQAGAYIARRHCSISEYMDIFQKERQKLLTYRPRQAKSRYQDVYATFEASAAVLQSSAEETAVDALQLLAVLGMVAPSQLPLSLFKAAWQGAQKVLSKSKKDIGEADVDSEDSIPDIRYLRPWHVYHLLPMLDVNESAWNDSRLLEAISLLELYSLVVISGERDGFSLSMHPLTHAWAKDRQNQEQLQLSWLKAGCIFALSDVHRPYWYRQGQNLRPHISRFASIEPDMIFDSGPQLMIARIVFRCAWLLERSRLTKDLHKLGRQVFNYFSLDITHTHEKWLPFYEVIGRNLVAVGESKESIAMLELVVSSLRQRLGNEHPDLLSSQHALAFAYRSSGQVEQAISLFEHVVKVQEQTRAEDDNQRLTSQHALAITYQRNGQIERAIALIQHVVKTRQQSLPEDHLSRLSSESELAVMLWQLGRIDEAMALMQKAVGLYRARFDEHFPDRRRAQVRLQRWCDALDKTDRITESKSDS